MQGNPTIGTTAPRWRSLCRGCARYASRPRAVLMLATVAVVLVKLTGEPTQWLLQGADSTLVLVTACVSYALLLAIPFVPSVEIGLLIMVLFGAPGALGAYLATCTGLSGAYLIGRCMGRSRLLERCALPDRHRTHLTRITGLLPAGCLPVLSLAALLNLPGNTVVGGGGGIAMAYGAGRLLSWHAFTATVAVATAVLPIAFVTGMVGLEQWLDTGEA